MKSITLEEFKNNYYPELNWYQFSDCIGFNYTFISKLKNATYHSRRTTKRINELKDYVKTISNCTLVLDDYITKESERTQKIVRNFQVELKLKDERIKELEKTVKELVYSIKILSCAQEAVKNGEFVLDKGVKNI